MAKWNDISQICIEKPNTQYISDKERYWDEIYQTMNSNSLWEFGENG